MNIEAFRESLIQDGFTIIDRAVAPNSSLEEHDHDWEVKAMITAGSFYVHTKTEQKTYRDPSNPCGNSQQKPAHFLMGLPTCEEMESYS